MLRILRPKHPTHFDPAMFFDLNGQPYQFVDEHHDFSIEWNDDKKPKIILDIWHNFENQSQRYPAWLEDDLVQIICNVRSEHLDNTRVHYVDFLFNRSKAYYLGYDFSQDTVLWAHEGTDIYRRRELDHGESKIKIFVAPNCLHWDLLGDVCFYRRQLVKHLSTHADKGWTSNPLLYSNHDQSIDGPTPPVKSFKSFNPIHQDYYLKSFVSIFGETVEHGQDIAVTEKTYEPLLKGHFILPFSTSGFIDYLGSIGIKFPSFIDYSYDKEKDDRTRYEKYQKEIDRLLAMSIDEWKWQWRQNYNLLLDNQQWVETKPYDRVDFNRLLSKF